MSKLAEVLLILVFSSWIISFTQVLFLKYDLKITPTKKQWILSVVIMSIFHDVLREFLPHIIFPVLFYAYSVFTLTIMFKIKITKVLWAMFKYFIITLVIEAIASLVCQALFNINFSNTELKVFTLIYSLPILALEFLTVLFIFRKRKENSKWSGFFLVSLARKARSK
jgi:hypothetical protein